MIINTNKTAQITGLHTKKLKEKNEEPKDILSSGQSDNSVKNLNDSIKQLKDNITHHAEQTSEYIDSHSWIKNTLDESVKFFKTMKAFPRFIYPSLIKMTEEERALVISVLDKMPMKFVGQVKSMTMLDSLPNASGGAGPVPGSPFVILTKDSFNNIDWAKNVVAHETGHTVDYGSGLFGLPIFSESTKEPWGKGPFITDYAKDSGRFYPKEWDDFAESFGYYYTRPEELKAKCPEKYQKIQELEKNNFSDSLIDKKAFRETGKLMGELMEKAPYLQNGLAMVALIGGFVQAYKGLGAMQRGDKTGDSKLKMEGTMDFAAGTCFASQIFSVVGLGIDGAKSELTRAIDKKLITPEQGNAVVQATIGIIAGPVGHAVNWVRSKMPWNKLYEITDSSFEKIKDKVPEYKLDLINTIKNKDFTKREIKKLLKKADLNEEEMSSVLNSLEKMPAIKKDHLLTVTDETLENLSNVLPDNKMDMINHLKAKDIPEKDLVKLLKKLELDSSEIELIKAFCKKAEPEKPPETISNEHTGSIRKAASIGIGGATGAVAGGFIGPYLGVLAGFALAGPVGGIVGLIGGAIAGYHGGARAGGELGNVIGTALEKIFDKDDNNKTKEDNKNIK